MSSATFSPDEIREWTVTERASLRLGYAGQGTPHGWTAQGKRILTLARKGRLRNCAVCHKPVEPTRKGKHAGSRRAYHYGCSDEFYNRYFRAWHITKRIVSRRDANSCRVCGWVSSQVRWSVGSTNYRLFRLREPLEFDHIVEIARGGDPLDPANVQMLCKVCHKDKTARFAAERAGRRTEAEEAAWRAAHPQLEQWTEGVP
ncbi:MAG: HNH endonuclease [Thermoplasmata archaeon]